MGFMPNASGAGSSAGILIGIPNVTALRVHPGAATQMVALRGYNNPTDSDQGLFQWDTANAVDDGVTRFNAGGLGSNTAGWQRVYSGPIDVKWGGAVGDGVTDDTAAVQRVVNAGPAVQISPGTYLVDAITIPVSLRRIDGSGTLKQRAAGQNVLQATSVSNITIEGISILGVGGNFFPVTDTAIKLTSCVGINVKGVTVTDMRTHAVHMVGCSFADIDGIRVTGCTGGVRATGTDHFRIHHSSFKSPNYMLFTVVIGIDSVNEAPHIPCTDFVVDSNVVENYINAQAVLLHSGVRGTIANNVFNDVLQGVSCQPFMIGDTMSDIDISDNIMILTTTNDGQDPSWGNYAVFYGGGAFVKQDVSKAFSVEGVGPVYTDKTAVCNSGVAGDYAPFPAGSIIGDYAMWGLTQPFDTLIFDYSGGTSGTVGVIVWEYYNGAAWVALSGVTDTTNSFKAAPADDRTVTFTAPAPFTTWAASSFNGSINLYWVRARITTAYTIEPNLDEGSVSGTFGASRGTIADNIIHNANAVLADPLLGGISLAYATDTNVIGNTITDPRAIGIVIGNPCTRVTMQDNIIRNVIASGGTQNGVYIRSGNAGTYSGRIQNNIIIDVTYGVRCDIASTFNLGRNLYQNYTNPVVGATNLVVNEPKTLEMLNETGLTVLRALYNDYTGGFNNLRLGEDYTNIEMRGGGVLGINQNVSSIAFKLPTFYDASAYVDFAGNADFRVPNTFEHYMRVNGTIEFLVNGTTVSIPTNNLSVAAGTGSFVGINSSGGITLTTTGVVTATAVDLDLRVDTGQFHYMRVNGNIMISVNGTGVSIPNGSQLNTGSTVNLGFFGATAVSQRSITGVLSAVVDANAKNVMTSIIQALVDLGFVVDNTT